MIEKPDEVIHQIEYKWPSRRLLVLGDVILDKYF
jgi:hypothetical protein